MCNSDLFWPETKLDLQKVFFFCMVSRYKRQLEILIIWPRLQLLFLFAVLDECMPNSRSSVRPISCSNYANLGRTFPRNVCPFLFFLWVCVCTCVMYICGMYVYLCIQVHRQKGCQTSCSLHPPSNSLKTESLSEAEARLAAHKPQRPSCHRSPRCWG